jgi:adenosylhomocysteine nucleosidase
VIAIAAALPEEMGPLRARLVGARRIPVSAALAVTGTLAGRKVALLVTGDGERNARAGVAALFDRLPITRLLVIGVSGALTSDLGPGTLLVGDRVCDGGGALHAPAPEVAAAVQRTGARAATLVTARRIADSPDERARLLRLFGDWPGPAAVDLESAVFVRAAAGREIPWQVVRAISDTAEERLPALLNESRDDDDGAVRRGRLLRGLLLAPGALPALLSLRWRVGRCAQVLAAAAQLLLTTAEDTGAAA